MASYPADHSRAAPPTHAPSNSSRSQPNLSQPVLEFSSHRIRSSTVACPSLGIQYQTAISRKAFDYVRTTFARLDTRSGESVVIAVWDKRRFGDPYLRIGPSGISDVENAEGEGTKEEDVFPQTSGRRFGFTL